MALSRPARVVVKRARFTPDEIARLEALSAEADITLSHAIRQGALEYLETVVVRQRERRDQLRLTGVK